MDYQKVLEEIKERIDIVDFVSEYVNLKKTGQNYRGLCPFHSEKTPSFFVSPSKKIFHCFGCGKGGDIVTFLMEHENISFQEALSILADRAGIEVEITKEKLSSTIKGRLYEIYKQATDFYVENLKKSDRAMKYLKSRGIDNRTIEKFQIGYATAEKTGLFDLLRTKNFDENAMKKSGLTGSNADFFRERIIFPIHDLAGRVIGFGGRLLDSKSELPKYINSPDTPIFKKGENLFGLWYAKRHIKEKGYVIIVEGYMDVILCHQSGFNNVVAPLGTALTLEQLKKIKRITNKILFVFDGDDAGITAVERSLIPAFQMGFIAKIVILKENEDPASILQKEGASSFKSYLAKPLTPVDFFLKIKKKKTLTEKTHDFLKAIANLKDTIYRDELLKDFSEKTELSEVTLRDELKKIISIDSNKEDYEAKNISILSEEEILIRLLISFPEKINLVFSYISFSDFENSMVKNLIMKINKLYDAKEYSFHKFFNMIDEDEKAFISKLIMSFEIEENLLSQYVNDCIKRIAIKSINKKIREVSKTGDENKLNELIKEKIKIQALK
ncbi:DNA primase [Thermodesulfovibrio sp.]|jgi:DNA primase|uniref:DNA primase n=1 Tax=Thermodesulfovibrio TaxID=28261 RepID=UPI00261FA816|nr:DNA primase [Thermodesulfovibrio sp.]